MADNKANALKEANYQVKLVLGRDPDHQSKIIDITAPVIESLSALEVFDSTTDYGIAYSIIGLLETSDAPNFLASTPLRTARYNIFLLQDINRILDATIVNAKQLEAVKGLVASAFEKREHDALMGLDHVLGECLKAQ